MILGPDMRPALFLSACAHPGGGEAGRLVAITESGYLKKGEDMKNGGGGHGFGSVSHKPGCRPENTREPGACDRPGGLLRVPDCSAGAAFAQMGFPPKAGTDGFLRGMCGAMANARKWGTAAIPSLCAGKILQGAGRAGEESDKCTGIRDCDLKGQGAAAVFAA